jgi:predicted nucleotidyltransferase
MLPVHRLGEEAHNALVVTLSEELASRPEVSFAYLYGSVLLKDGFRDVDVAVWTTGLAHRLVDVDLAARLSRRIGLPVDVRRINDAPLSFAFHALQGRLLSVRDELLLATLIESTARRYHDQAPILLRATREAFVA